jgi:hypothetical protein
MKKAVLVGINEYSSAPLNGCVNDVNDMAEFLVSKCKYSEENIRLLTDDRATKARILERLEWLVAGAKAGDNLFFQYSGHGTQIVSRNKKEEIDGKDEVICCVNFDWDHPSTYITDNEFMKIFNKCANVGAKLWWISDSCHSGTLNRDALLGRLVPRMYPMHNDFSWRNRGAEKLNKTVKTKTSTTPNGIFISGCKDNQTSADAYFKGRYNGAFTKSLLDVLYKYIDQEAPLTWKQVMDKSVELLKKGKFTQVPQFQCEHPQSLVMDVRAYIAS